MVKKVRALPFAMAFLTHPYRKPEYLASGQIKIHIQIQNKNQFLSPGFRLKEFSPPADKRLFT